jgi:hypothetical protein
MTTIEKVAYNLGIRTALIKVGMDESHHELIQKLQNAVIDEAEGEEEYQETADEADRVGESAMARAHKEDEARHGDENKDALHQLYLKS